MSSRPSAPATTTMNADLPSALGGSHSTLLVLKCYSGGSLRECPCRNRPAPCAGRAARRKKEWDGEGREDPASRASGSVRALRVAHAPCRCPDRPEKRGQDRAQIGAQFREQIHVTIALAVALAINLA